MSAPAPLAGHEALALGLYRALAWAARPLLRRKLARRARQEPGYALDLPARFGHRPEGVAPGPGGWLWVHAVSLGETRAAAVLLQALRRQQPGLRLLLTHGTATGREAGRALLQPGDVQTWLPWDDAASVRRFLAGWRPALGLLLETEVWPGLVQGCRAAGVPLALVNARVSARSARALARVAWLSRPAHAGLAAAWAQSVPDAERLRALGGPVAPAVGNLKFDATPDGAQQALAAAWRVGLSRPVVVLASSRDGEEAMLLQALARQPQARQVQWLVVPRHPQRFAAVATAIEAAGWRCLRRSQWPAAGPAADAGGADDRPTLWLGDSLGEMALYYGLADAALLGGSYGPWGGQNLIEAAACGCPLLLGPHTDNFAEAAGQALAAGGARRVADLDAALRLALHWCGPAEASRRQAARAAREFAAAHRGAAERTAQGVLALLAASPARLAPHSALPGSAPGPLDTAGLGRC